jgi:hypothetical protein
VSACEWCWSEAQRRVMFGGGSVSRHYEIVLREQEAMGRLARCPTALSENEKKQREALR